MLTAERRADRIFSLDELAKVAQVGPVYVKTLLLRAGIEQSHSDETGVTGYNFSLFVFFHEAIGKKIAKQGGLGAYKTAKDFQSLRRISPALWNAIAVRYNLAEVAQGDTASPEALQYPVAVVRAMFDRYEKDVGFPHDQIRTKAKAPSDPSSSFSIHGALATEPVFRVGLDDQTVVDIKLDIRKKFKHPTTDVWSDVTRTVIANNLMIAPDLADILRSAEKGAGILLHVSNIIGPAGSSALEIPPYSRIDQVELVAAGTAASSARRPMTA